MTVDSTPFRQLMEEVKYGRTTTSEAAARIDAYVEQLIEKALRDRGIVSTPTAEQRLLRDLRDFSGRDA